MDATTRDPSLCDCDPVGLAEIHVRLGVKRETVDMWRVRGILPAPSWTVGGRPAWRWRDVEAWARATRRLPAVVGSTLTTGPAVGEDAHLA